MKLKIKNFQSAEDVELEIPEKSFTCLVGPTNIGKSAIRRALECVLYNKSEISYIRQGTTTCEVELTLGDGTHIKWSRDKKTAYYEVNGESFSKLNGSVPDILLSKGFRELSLSREKFAVQIASQFDNIFLLNQSGSKITEVLSNLGNLNRIIEANKSCLTDKKSIRSRLKIRVEDNSLARQKVSSFTGLDAQKDKVTKLKELVAELRTLQENREKAAKLQSKLRKSMVVVSELRKLKNTQAPELDVSLDQFNALGSLYSKYLKHTGKVLKFEPLKNVNEIDFELNDDLAKFSSIKKLHDNLILKEHRIKQYQNMPKLISDIDINLSDLEVIKKLSDRLETSKSNVLSYRNKIKESEEKLKEYEVEFHQVRSDLKVCPICDSSLI